MDASHKQIINHIWLLGWFVGRWRYSDIGSMAQQCKIRNFLTIREADWSRDFSVLSVVLR